MEQPNAEREHKLELIGKMALDVRVTGWRDSGDDDFLRAEPVITEYVYEQVEQQLAV